MVVPERPEPGFAAVVVVVVVLVEVVEVLVEVPVEVLVDGLVGWVVAGTVVVGAGLVVGGAAVVGGAVVGGVVAGGVVGTWAGAGPRSPAGWLPVAAAALAAGPTVERRTRRPAATTIRVRIGTVWPGCSRVPGISRSG
jgi:hypothetical protein